MEVLHSLTNNHSLISNATLSHITSLFNRYWYTGVIILFLFSLGFILNLIIIVMMVKIDKIKSSSDVLFLVLAICDSFISIITCVYCVIVYVTYSINWSAAVMTPACKAISFLLFTCNSLHILTLALISMDRYILIVYPTRSTFKSRTVFILLVSIWLLSFCFPVVVVSDIIADPTFKVICIYSWEINGRHQIGLVVASYVFFVGFLLPGGVITYCHLRAIKNLHQVRLRVNQHFVHGNSGGGYKERAIKMLICILILFLTAGLPPVIVFVSNVYGELNAAILTKKDYEALHITNILVGLLVYFAPLHNPIIYLMKKNVIHRCSCIRIRHTRISQFK
ncbi:Opsin-5 [Trichoplax sp. H2]|nr:Opsin-5 [Trichoplax sp. H2]|eukprot:RDD40953.1 Opsin-5 [Trichoplax sp. H2]